MLLEIVIADEEMGTGCDEAGDVAAGVVGVGDAEEFVNCRWLGFLALGFSGLPLGLTGEVVVREFIFIRGVWCGFLSVGVDAAW